MNESLLRQVPLFAALPPDEIAELAGTLQSVSVPAQTLLFYEGDASDRFYIVLAGTVEIVKALATPDERLLGVRGPGEFVGEMGLISEDHRRTASVRVRTPAHLLELTRADFEALLRRQPALAYQMVRVLGARLREADNATIRDLQERNRQLAAAYRELEAAQAQLIEKERLERDLQLARDIQTSMLPTTRPHLAGFDFAAQMVPAQIVGGDFFDLFPLGDEQVGVVVGDVSGKGLPAALFMALTRSLVRAEASRAGTPREALLRVNAHLLDMNASGMFVTVLYGVLERSSGAFGYARAGHELPVLIDTEGVGQLPVYTQGQPLALWESPAIDEQRVIVPPEGLLLLYTDGVPDALDPSGRSFGLEGLLAALRTTPGLPAQAVCERVLQAITQHQATAPPYDDVTLLTLCRCRPASGPGCPG